MTELSHTVAAALTELHSSMHVLRWLTPEYLPAHAESLAAVVTRGGAEYPGSFTYAPVDLSQSFTLLDRATLAASAFNGPLGAALTDELKRTHATLDAVGSRDDELLSAWACTHTGLPDTSTRHEAHRLLASPPDPQPLRNQTSADLADAIGTALAAYSLSGWTIKFSPAIASRASITGSRRLVQIRAGLRLSSDELTRLVVHEIGGHVLRWENAYRQTEPLLAVPLGDTTPTEEGLAALLEERFSVSNNAQLRTYATRVHAVELAQTEGIVGLARQLRSHVGLDAAVSIALRVKRGLIDPNRPGGLTKDHSYLTGLLALRKLHESALAVLQGTKWPLSLLELAKELSDPNHSSLQPDERLLALG